MSFWNEYIENLKRLQKGGGKIFSIGESVLGRPIFCVQIGKGAKKLLVQYAIHAREHITCHLAIRQAENILKENVDGTIFILPLINPDGVCLATDGIKSLSEVGADLSLLNGHFAFTNKVPLLSQTEISRLKKWLQTHFQSYIRHCFVLSLLKNSRNPTHNFTCDYFMSQSVRMIHAC